jgi:hypothetical protein
MLPAIPQTAQNEEAKLTAAFVNSMAIAAFIAGALGPYITNIPDADLPAHLRILLALSGLVLHVAARLVLRYIK